MPEGGILDAVRLAEACESLPLFPLPGTVLLPGSLLPLHVFEPRYRQLVADCLRDGLPLCVPQLREDEVRDAAGRPAFHPYAAVGVIGAHQPLEDGRCNIVVQPLARVMLEEERVSGRLYRIARARVLEDAPCSLAALRLAGDRVRVLFAPHVGGNGGGDGARKALANLPAERVAEGVAGLVLRPADARQRFLSEDCPLARALMVEEALLTGIAELVGAAPAEA